MEICNPSITETTHMPAYAYVPVQIAKDTNLYNAQAGLDRGTIFPTLDLPLGVYGKQVRQKGGDCDE